MRKSSSHEHSLLWALRFKMGQMFEGRFNAETESLCQTDSCTDSQCQSRSHRSSSAKLCNAFRRFIIAIAVISTATAGREFLADRSSASSFQLISQVVEDGFASESKPYWQVRASHPATAAGHPRSSRRMANICTPGSTADGTTASKVRGISSDNSCRVSQVAGRTCHFDSRSWCSTTQSSCVARSSHIASHSSCLGVSCTVTIADTWKHGRYHECGFQWTCSLYRFTHATCDQHELADKQHGINRLFVYHASHDAYACSCLPCTDGPTTRWIFGTAPRQLELATECTINFSCDFGSSGHSDKCITGCCASANSADTSHHSRQGTSRGVVPQSVVQRNPTQTCNTVVSYGFRSSCCRLSSASSASSRLCIETDVWGFRRCSFACPLAATTGPVCAAAGTMSGPDTAVCSSPKAETRTSSICQPPIGKFDCDAQETACCSSYGHTHSATRCSFHSEFSCAGYGVFSFTSGTENSQSFEISGWPCARTTECEYDRPCRSSTTPQPSWIRHLRDGAHRDSGRRLAWTWDAQSIVAVGMGTCNGRSGLAVLHADNIETTPALFSSAPHEVLSSSPSFVERTLNRHHRPTRHEQMETHVLDLWCVPDGIDESPRPVSPCRVAGSAFSTQESHTAPRILSLDQTIPQPTQDECISNMISRFHELRHPWPENACYWTLDFLALLPDLNHEHLSLLSLVPIWNQEDVEHVHIFVDGSSFDMNRHEPGSQAAAWAFIVVLQCTHHTQDRCYRFYCAMSRPLTGSHSALDSVQDVGELLHDALSSEAVGMIWAMSWWIQAPFDCKATFHYDNSTVGPFSSGLSRWNATWEYQRLRQNLTTLRHFAQAIGKVFGHQHLKAHVGHPWSEAVDAAAKAAAKGILVPLGPIDQLSRALNHPYAYMAWMAFSPQNVFPRPDTLRAIFAAEGPFDSQEEDVVWHPTLPSSTDQSVEVSLKFASANVLTLSSGTFKEQSQGLYQLGRIATLQSEFSQVGIHLIGLQECRTQGAQNRHSQTHLVYQSGATMQGTHGCELWVDRRRPYAKGPRQRYFFQDQHFHVASYDHRHLLVVVNAPFLSLRLLVVHAPHQQANDAAVDIHGGKT